MAADGSLVQDGVYTFETPVGGGRLESFASYCRLVDDDDWWMVVQRRVDDDVTFNRSWSEYRRGFGRPELNGNFWLGLQTVHRLTKRARSAASNVLLLNY